jgi:hypothetical protein
MNSQHTVPSVFGRLVRWRAFTDVNAGGVNEDVEASELAKNLVCRAFCFGAFRKVGIDDDRAPTVATEPCGGFLRCGAVCGCADRDMGPLSSEGLDDCGPDPA